MAVRFEALEFLQDGGYAMRGRTLRGGPVMVSVPALPGAFELLRESIVTGRVLRLTFVAGRVTALERDDGAGASSAAPGGQAKEGRKRRRRGAKAEAPPAEPQDN